MKELLTKLWQAIKYSIKWILIQYAVIFCLSFLYYGSLYIWSLFTDYSFRDLSITHQIGGHTVYSWYTALLFTIPNYTVLFSFGYVLFNKRKQWWTILIPWVLNIGWVYLEIAKGLDWNYKIITVDEYMLAGWLSPLLGALLQGINIFFRK